MAPPFRALAHEPSAAQRAVAERAASALLDAVERAASDAERCEALKALHKACHASCETAAAAPRGSHVAVALVRLGAVSRLCTLAADCGEPGAAPSTAFSKANLIFCVGALLDTASEGQCACCQGGPTPAGAEAVEQLVRCGGLSHLATLLQGRSHVVAFEAARCTSKVFKAVLYSPALDEVLSTECLENVLYLAGGDPRPFDAHDEDAPAIMMLVRLQGAFKSSSDAALRLARLPATLPLLCRFLEPDLDVKRLEMVEPYRACRDVGAGLRLLQGVAVAVLAQVFGAMREVGDELPQMFVTPLLLSLLHIIMTNVSDEAAIQCIEFVCDTTAPQLAKLVPIAMLRALCAQADSADGYSTALGAAQALACCNEANAALLFALLPPTSRHRLGAHCQGAPAALSAAQVERLRKTQLDTARRAFRASTDAASDAEDHALALSEAESAELTTAAFAATTARARLALQRAAMYVKLCAMAPNVSLETFLACRSYTIRNGYRLVSADGQTAQAAAGGWPDVSCVYSTSGLYVLTLGEAPDLHLLLDVPGLEQPDAADDTLMQLLRHAARMALFRVARSHGWDLYDQLEDGQQVPALPLFDANGAFVLSKDEAAFYKTLPPSLAHFTWRFEPWTAMHGSSGGRLDDRDYVCSLAAALPTAPPRITAQLCDRLAARSAAHEDDCSGCATCMAARAVGRLCGLPSCQNTQFVDGTALKLCKRCTRVAYCCREVRGRAPLR